MGFKQINYNAGTNDDPESINGRLSQAHKHDNLEQLNALSAEIWTQILNVLSTYLDKDLTRINSSNLKKLIEQLGIAFHEAPEDGKTYGRKGGDWADITNAIKDISITSESLSVILGDDKNYTIELDEQSKANIAAVSAKMDKVDSGETTENHVAIIQDGSAAASEIEKTNLLLRTMLSDAIDSPLSNVPASAKAVSLVNEAIRSLSSGLGTTRGTVYNAFTSTVQRFTVTAIAVKDGGSGYCENDSVRYAGDSSDLLLRVTQVDVNGVVQELEITRNGSFDNDPAGDVALSGGNGSGLRVTLTTKETPSDTLLSIENPKDKDIAYVTNDEVHGNVRSIWIYTSLDDSSAPSWVWLMSFPASGGVTIYRESE